MEGKKGFEAPKNGPHVKDEVFDSEIDLEIDKGNAEQEKSYREVCSRIQQEDTLMGVHTAIKNYYGGKVEYVEFTDKAIEHVCNVAREEMFYDYGDIYFTIYESFSTLLDYGFPREILLNVIHEGTVYGRKVADEEGVVFVFRKEKSDEEMVEFFDNLMQQLHFTPEEILTPAVQQAALRMMKHIPGNESKGKTMKELKYIKVFHLVGEDVTAKITKRVEELILQERFTPDQVQRLCATPDYHDNDESISPKTIDEAWQKLQERYQISQSYQELQQSLLYSAITQNDISQIRGICNSQSKILAELTTAQMLPRILELADRTVYVASNVGNSLTKRYSDRGWIVGAVLEQFDVSSDTVLKWFEYTSSDNKLFLQKFSREVLDPDAALTLEILGENAKGVSYELIKKIKQGKNKEFSHTGITKSGEAGIQELRTLLSHFKQDILKEDVDIGQLLENPVLHDFTNGYLRINEREFGSRSLGESAKLYEDQKAQIKPLDALVYQRSEPVRIRTRESDKDFEYSEQFLSTFKALNRDIDKACRLVENATSKPFSNLVEHLDQEVGQVIDELQRTQLDLPEEKRRFIYERISRLEALNFRDLTKLDHNLAELNRIPEAHRVVRQLIFTFAYSKSQGQNMYIPPFDYTQPTLSDITGAINFVDHIAYQETWAQYFKDKKSRNNFRQIASTRALEEELERMQKSKSGETGTTVMQFVPTRGFLMEVSGSLADACWEDTSKELIALEHPNFTSVTFVQNPETKDERIAGACMLIEAKSSGDEKFLIIRGLNPLENVINRLSVEDFYNQFTGYCKGIAERSGRKLAIVIDDHSGGSATNRPILFQYLQSLPLRKAPLIFDSETNFNGYSIVHNTFLVE